jgi:hypothetical protein
MLSHRNLAQMTLAYFADVDAVERDGRLLARGSPLARLGASTTSPTLVHRRAQVSPRSLAGSTRPRCSILVRRARRWFSFFGGAHDREAP